MTSALGGDDAIDSMFLVFKTGVSSDPAQAGSIPVRLREPGRVRGLCRHEATATSC
jgi:hypothetical protein